MDETILFMLVMTVTKFTRKVKTDTQHNPNKSLGNKYYYKV